MYTFSNLFNEVKKYKKELIWANIIALFATLVGSLIPLLMPLLVDEILLGKGGFATDFIDKMLGSKSEVYVYVLLVLALAVFLRVLFFILNFFQTKFFTIISKNITFKMRQDVLKRLSEVSLSGFEFFGSGKASSLAIIDINTIDEFLGTTISRFIISFLQLICVFMILFFISWQLAFFILLVNPFVVLLTTKIAKKVSHLKKQQNEAFSIFQDAFSETLELFVQIRTSNMEKSFFGSLSQKLENIKESSINFTYKSDTAHRFSFLVFMIGFEAFRGAGIIAVAYSDLSVGMMIATFSYLWMLMNPIQDMLNIQYAFANAKIAMDRINEIFLLPLEPKYPHLKNPFLHKNTNSISLKNINFSYDNKRKVLDRISMEIPKGKKVAIIGASGSGKTSLAQILVGFYPFESGELMYDGVSSKEIGLDVIRENVFLVLQNPQLFNSSIKENISFGENVSDEQIKKAIQIAQLSSFIGALPDKLDTKIGKNGIRLSGGQRQRLSIARMIAKSPNIVILDESTSALDVHTENILFDELSEYLKDKTTIIIAHRLSTIRNADYIYVLDKGKILEEGTHMELLNKDGAFASYYEKNKG
ncbi:MAG: ABC transporter ATP-binding protein [Proteobacteria bacterium]|nr:MAG: ABC transporter ATP-binding protein [Pseudomonadota bacterium]